MNHVIIMGRLTRDPELKTTQSGKSVCTVSVAVDRQKEGADFFTVTAWEKTAEFISQYFGKGRMIAVEGRLTTRSWEDRDGKKRTATEIIADRVHFCGDRPAERDTAPATPGAEYAEIADDGELPF